MATTRYKRRVFAKTHRGTVPPKHGAHRLTVRRDPRTGMLVIDKIVSPTGVIVKGGPITGERKSSAADLTSLETKLSRQRMARLLDLMKIEQS